MSRRPDAKVNDQIQAFVNAKPDGLVVRLNFDAETNRWMGIMEMGEKGIRFICPFHGVPDLEFYYSQIVGDVDPVLIVEDDNWYARAMADVTPSLGGDDETE